jgi:hypothetical protein
MLLPGILICHMSRTKCILGNPTVHTAARQKPHLHAAAWHLDLPHVTHPALQIGVVTHTPPPTPEVQQQDSSRVAAAE